MFSSLVVYCCIIILPISHNRKGVSQEPLRLYVFLCRKMLLIQEFFFTTNLPKSLKLSPPRCKLQTLLLGQCGAVLRTMAKGNLQQDLTLNYLRSACPANPGSATTSAWARDLSLSGRVFGLCTERTIKHSQECGESMLWHFPALSSPLLCSHKYTLIERDPGNLGNFLPTKVDMAIYLKFYILLEHNLLEGAWEWWNLVQCYTSLWARENTNAILSLEFMWVSRTKETNPLRPACSGQFYPCKTDVNLK